MSHNSQLKHKNKNYILKSELQFPTNPQDNQNSQNTEDDIDNPLVK